MRVLQTCPLPEPCASIFREAGVEVDLYPGPGQPSPGELTRRAAGADGLLCLLSDEVTEDLMRAAPRLRVVSNYAVGHNNVDLAAATRRGIVVCNTPGVLDDTTADLAFALMLSVARRVVEGDRLLRGGGFAGWEPEFLLGADVWGRTLGVVGMGRIGQCVARRARGFNMKVLYTQRSRHPEELEGELQVTYASLTELLEESDFVTLHVDLNPSTAHLIGAAELAQMKPWAYVINTSRGPVIDEDALAEALERGQIAGAGLDVYEHEPLVSPRLLAHDRTVLLPHVGSATRETRSKMAELAARNMVEALAGRRPPHAVNYDQLAPRP